MAAEANIKMSMLQKHLNIRNDRVLSMLNYFLNIWDERQ
jgi:hypothetical protein